MFGFPSMIFRISNDRYEIAGCPLTTHHYVSSKTANYFEVFSGLRLFAW
jgi:hypothetical protein